MARGMQDRKRPGVDRGLDPRDEFVDRGPTRGNLFVGELPGDDLLEDGRGAAYTR